MKTQYNMIIEKLAQNMAHHMQGNKEDNKSIIAYGLHVFIFNGFIGLITLITAMFLGLFFTAATALAASGSLRIFTGGYHCSKPLLCMFITIFAINLYGYAALIISSILSFNSLVIILVVIMLLCLGFIIKNAPVETANKPIKADRRPVLKKRGICVWLLWTVTFTLLMSFQADSYSHIVLAAGLGIASQTFSISGIMNNKEVK